MGSRPLQTEKQTLRARFRARRASLTPEAVREASDAVSARVRDLLVRRGVRVVGTYAAADGEPSVELGGAVALLWPRCVGATLEFAAEPLAPGRFGLAEPVGLAADAELLDAIIVPGVAFGHDGARLGRGVGFYDRFLPRMRPDALRVGVCYGWQLLGSVPTDPHDVAMTHVVTEDRTWAVAELGGSLEA